MHSSATDTSRVAVVAPLKYGAYSEARRLVEEGPPFEPGDTPLERHDVFLTDTEAVFFFEGPGVREAIEGLLDDVAVWQALLPWHECLAGRPRVASDIYHWSRAEAA